MKEIKFRAWDKKHQKMFTRDGVPSKDGICVENEFWGHFLSLSTLEVWKIMTRAQNQQDYREKVDFELMQYTGINDKNGREIYEGDIVKIVTNQCVGEKQRTYRRKKLTYPEYADVVSIGAVKWGKTQYPYDKVSVYYVDTENELTYYTYSYQMKSSDPPRTYKTKIKPALEEVKSVEVIGNIHENPELLDVDMSNENEHDYTDEIVCPWCGHSNSDSWEVGDGLQECENCEKSFYVARNIVVTHSTQKVNYGTCKHCGEEDVPIENWHGIIVRYESLCPDCGAKEWIRQLDEYSKVLEEEGADHE